MNESESGGVILADDWKLVPVDGRNWELCHRHVTQARGRHQGGTEPTWHRCGRFYSYSTVGSAFVYVADELLKAKVKGEAVSLVDALREYERIMREFAGIEIQHLENS